MGEQGRGVQIIVKAAKAVAAFFGAGLEAGHQQAAGTQGAVDTAEVVGQLAARRMQQGGTGPDAIIGGDFIQFGKAHQSHRLADAAPGFGGQGRGGVGGRHDKAALKHIGGIVATTGAQLEDGGARR